MLGQTDDFPAKIAPGCATEEGCAQVNLEAERRVRGCADNTIGKLRCSDTQSDLAQVRHLQERFVKAKEDAELARRVAAGAAAERERQDDRDREVRERASAQVDEWIRHALDTCDRSANRDACSAVPSSAGDEARKRCAEDCAAAVDKAKEREYKRALRECVTDLVDANGKGKADCRFQFPGASTENLDDRRNACAGECVEQAKPIIQRAKAAGLGGGSAPASGGTSTPTQPSGGSRAKCCDGQLSPTCACPGHQGCCSHHGGVCGCGG